MGGSISQEEAPTVAIVGGGMAGLNLAMTLDASKKFNTVVIERRAHSTWPLSLHRAAVVPGWEAKSNLPYNQALKRGSVIQGDVTHIDDQGVHIAGRPKPIQADYTVIAVGAANPIHPPTQNLDETIGYYSQLQRNIAASKRIAVVGAGSVGIELAGEIAGIFTGAEAKIITLIGNDPRIMPVPNFSEKARKEVLNKIGKMGINFLGGKRVVLPVGPAGTPQFATFGPTELDLGGGETLTVDAVFNCTGSRVNTQIYQEYLKGGILPNGRIQVDEFFQPIAIPAARRGKLFAIGDCSDVETFMTAFSGKLTGNHLAKNLVRAVDKKAMIPYEKSNIRAAFLHLTTTGGVGYYNTVGKDPESGMLFGDFLVKVLKSKELMVPDYEKMQKSGKDIPVHSRIRHLATLLQVDEPAAALQLPALA